MDGCPMSNGLVIWFLFAGGAGGLFSLGEAKIGVGWAGFFWFEILKSGTHLLT